MLWTFFWNVFFRCRRRNSKRAFKRCLRQFPHRLVWALGLGLRLNKAPLVALQANLPVVRLRALRLVKPDLRRNKRSKL